MHRITRAILFCCLMATTSSCLPGLFQDSGDTVGDRPRMSFAEKMLGERNRLGPSGERLALQQAIGKAVLESSHGSKGTNALFDGNLGNRWTTECPQEPGMWLTIQLPGPLAITSITMDHGPSRNDYPREYEVYFSADGKTWGKPIRKGRGARGRTKITGLGETTAHVKILQTGSDERMFWSIHDLKINGMSLAGQRLSLEELWQFHPHHAAWLTQDAVLDREAA